MKLWTKHPEHPEAANAVDRWLGIMPKGRFKNEATEYFCGVFAGYHAWFGLLNQRRKNLGAEAVIKF